MENKPNQIPSNNCYNGDLLVLQKLFEEFMATHPSQGAKLYIADAILTALVQKGIIEAGLSGSDSIDHRYGFKCVWWINPSWL